MQEFQKEFINKELEIIRDYKEDYPKLNKLKETLKNTNQENI